MKKTKKILLSLFVIIFLFLLSPFNQVKAEPTLDLSGVSGSYVSSDPSPTVGSASSYNSYTGSAYTGTTVIDPNSFSGASWQTQGQWDPTSGAPKATAVSESQTAADQAAYQAQLKKMYTGYATTTTNTQSPASAAASGCVGSFVGNWVAGKMSSALSSMTSSIGSVIKLVPTDDTNQKSANYRDETLNGIAFCIGNALIDAMTASMVQWINNGFKNPDGTSGPGFLTNPGEFFKQVADREVGAFFQGLGPIGSMLCKPFDLQIRLALLNEYNGAYGQQQCSLESIKQNFANFGSGGNYMGDWFQLTQQDNNNAIGSYFMARKQMAEGIVYNVEQNKMEVNLGQGFMSLKKCVKYSTTAKDPNTGKATCSQWETTTPGKEVQESLNRAIGSKTNRLEIATDFNQIVSALVSQLIKQAMSGLSGQNDYGGSSGYGNKSNKSSDYLSDINDISSISDSVFSNTSTSTQTATTTTATSTFDSGFGL